MPLKIDSYVKDIFAANMATHKLVLANLVPLIGKAALLIAQAVACGNKILSCGNGGSACDAAHFTGEMANRFLIERDGLPAITLGTDVALLTAIANDYEYKYVFSRQLKAIGKTGDILLAISTSGNSPNILEAVQMAHKCAIQVIMLSGKDGGAVAKILTPNDLEIRIPATVTPRIQEMHTIIVHCICELVEKLSAEEETI